MSVSGSLCPAPRRTDKVPTRLSCVQGLLCLQQPLPEGPAVRGRLAGPERTGPAACVSPRASAVVSSGSHLGLALGCPVVCPGTGRPLQGSASPVAPRARLARPPQRCNSHICPDLLVQSKAWCLGNCRRKITALLVPLSSQPLRRASFQPRTARSVPTGPGTGQE